MKLSVEMYVQEKGFVNISKGYLRDSHIELEDILKWTKSQLILISDQVLHEEQLKGFDKKPVVVVDGRTNKKPIDVSPLGQIEFISRKNVGDIILAAYDMLTKLSPVDTGLYKSSHYVFLNGVQVATDLSTLEAWTKNNPQIKDNDVLRIVNIQPYGRRLELLGVTSKRQQSRRVEKKRKGVGTGVMMKRPNGAYQLTYSRMRSRFKNNIGIFFRFIPGSQLGISAYFKKGRKTERPGNKTSAKRTYLYPSLVFKVGKGGLLGV